MRIYNFALPVSFPFSKIEEYGVKVLGNGNIDKALTIKASKFSKSALEKIEKAGGKAEEV